MCWEMYMKLLTISTILIAVIRCGPSPKESPQNKHASIVGDLGYCRTTLIASKWMITTASCFKKMRYKKKGQINIRDATNKKIKIDYINVFKHPKNGLYKDTVPINDVVLLELAKPLMSTPVRLPDTKTIPSKADMMYDYKVPLKTINMDILSYMECMPYFNVSQRLIINHMNMYGEIGQLDQYLICTKSVDNPPGPCMETLGSPLIHKNKLYGLATTQYDYGAVGQNCYRLYMFTNIISYIDWINKVIKSDGKRRLKHITSMHNLNLNKDYWAPLAQKLLNFRFFIF